MKSPFPGLDPFIEAAGLWEDFHNHLVESIAAALADTVPPHYFVKSGERAYVVLLDPEEENGRTEHLIKPDTGISAPRTLQPQPATAVQEAATEAGADADADIVSVRALLSDSFRESFVEIYAESAGRELVTCIEVLSPSNKRFGSEGWELYLRKRQALLLGQANFVELDLLRGGQKMPMLDPWPPCPYTVLVSRRQRTPHCRVWKVWTQKPLPAINVPLLASDSDVALDLQSLVSGIYGRYRYDRQIDYTKPCTPALSDDDAAWLREALQGRS